MRQWTTIFLIGFLLVCLHITGSVSFGQSKKGGRSSARDAERGEDFRREVIVPAQNMLKAGNVAIDPELLFEDDWRALIAPALAQRPEMKETLRVTEPMAGLYLADMVLLPKQISLKGDTLILTRELAPDDENSVINISGHYRLFIFNIGDPRKYEAMAGNQPQGQFLNINVEDSCVLVGIAPMYLGTYRCRGAGYMGGWKKRT